MGTSYFTTLVIRNAHGEVMHQEVEATLNRIRERFWIIKGRRSVKNILFKCIICKRYQGKTLLSPPPPDLPDFRIDCSYAFCNVGLDYAGPLYVRNFTMDATLKVYFLLITCASSRAIHLELVPNLKSPAFIRAMTRFISKRGAPNLVVHDNAKTFLAKEVKTFLTQRGIEQKFILPASPWWGGFYERLVRSVKLSLRKTLGRSLVTYEELQTLLCQIEAVVNCRPLTYVSSDDLEDALTPSHLIYGRNISHHVVDTSQIAAESDFSGRVRYIQTLLSHYWKHFSSYYLNELRQQQLYRDTRNTVTRKLKLNDVVLIRDDTPLPRQRWKMGKVEKLIIGEDGNIRGAKLIVNVPGKLSNTICHRPVQKIIPFEIVDDEDTSQLPEEKLPDEIVRGDGRPSRRAAIEGQTVRRLKEKYG